jgi:hypothetical protein
MPHAGKFNHSFSCLSPDLYFSLNAEKSADLAILDYENFIGGGCCKV